LSQSDSHYVFFSVAKYEWALYSLSKQPQSEANLFAQPNGEIPKVQTYLILLDSDIGVLEPKVCFN